MVVLPNRPTRKGAPDHFTGDVWIDDIATAEGPLRLHISRVRFAPGARTAWHRHRIGQTLCVTDGIGLVSHDNEIMEIRPGDTVQTAKDEWHWHGATPNHFMEHISLVEAPAEGPEPVWGQHVTDTEYGPTSAVTLYHIASKFMLKSGHRADFVTAALEDQRNSLTTERGTLRFEVIADEENEDCFYLDEVYASKAEFEAHQSGPHYGRFFKLIADYASDPIRLISGTRIVHEIGHSES